ncbi:MAG: restriction endonuclease subunit S [Phycisphaeraceae bacterium]|nr:MAG: restriction endonuclease subunit S [Phycisphaeraceae bacterium]
MNREALLESLAMIGESTDGIARLRKLAIKLAVQGVLVPQDLSEGHGNDVLKTVDPSKDRRLRPKQIRDPKPLPSLSTEEIPDRLPRNWAVTRLGLVTQLQYGDGIDKSERDDNGSVPVMGSNGVLGYHSEALVPGPVIVVGRKGSAGALTLQETECWPSDVTYFVHAPDGIEIRYWLLTLENLDLPSLSNGIKPGLNREAAHMLPVAIPPLAEQRRIVAKVDELMGLLDELERARDWREARRAAFRDSALAALQNAEDAQAAHAAWTRIATNLADCLTDPADIAPLRQTILQLAVRGRLVPQDPGDDPVENLTASAAKELKAINAQKRTKTVADRPEYERDDPLPNGWAWVALQQIAQFIDYRGKTPKKTKSGVRLYTAKNIRPGRIVSEPAEFVSPATYKTWMTRGFPIRGDVLFTTEAPMGNAAVIDETVEPVFALAQRTICIHPVGGMDGRYLMNMMLSPWFRAELASRATGMTATGIKAAKLRLIRVPVPPVAEQHRIVAKVDELMAVCDELEQQLAEAKAHQSAFAAAAVHYLEI